MKRALLFASFVAIMACGFVAPAQAQGKFGAGVQLGYPGNGLSFNYYLSQTMSVQVNPQLGLHENWSHFGARADLLFWMPKLASWGFADLRWYWGPGASLFMASWTGDSKFKHDGYFGVGAELPVGIGLLFKGAPIDLNLEAVPVLGIIGSGGVDIGIGVAGVLNARYYF
jgi:hypothetical protein